MYICMLPLPTYLRSSNGYPAGLAGWLVTSTVNFKGFPSHTKEARSIGTCLLTEYHVTYRADLKCSWFVVRLTSKRDEAR